MAMKKVTLLEINNKDYTSKIKVPTYRVNADDTIDTWEDANYVKHYVLLHRHISGTFTLLFDNPDEYDEFLEDLKACKYLSDDEQNSSNCYKNIRLFCNNDKYADGGSEIKWRVYPKFTHLTFTPPNTFPYMGTSKDDGIECTVEGDIVL